MTAHTITIAYIDQGFKSRYEATVSRASDRGEMTVSKPFEKTTFLDHTGVPDALRGKGVAGALAKRVIADARAKGQKIVWLCPFWWGYAMKRKEELSDVIQF